MSLNLPLVQSLLVFFLLVKIFSISLEEYISINIEIIAINKCFIFIFLMVDSKKMKTMDMREIINVRDCVRIPKYNRLNINMNNIESLIIALLRLQARDTMDIIQNIPRKFGSVHNPTNLPYVSLSLLILVPVRKLIRQENVTPKAKVIKISLLLISLFMFNKYTE